MGSIMGCLRSELGAEPRICRDQREEQKTHADEDEIQHALRSAVGARGVSPTVDSESMP